MDPSLRQARTEIVTAGDYEEHMASIGQAKAAAELTEQLIRSASLTAGGRIAIAGAGTGQMFDFLAPAIFISYRLTCADLNPAFLARLRERLGQPDVAWPFTTEHAENPTQADLVFHVSMRRAHVGPHRLGHTVKTSTSAPHSGDSGHQKPKGTLTTNHSNCGLTRRAPSAYDTLLRLIQHVERSP